MSPRKILLRLTDNGQPTNSESVKDGVLILPAIPPRDDHRQGDPLFDLKFELSSSAEVACKGKLYVNTPKSLLDVFDRTKFHQYKLTSSFHKDIAVPVHIYQPGSFSYYIQYENKDGEQVKTDNYYFNVPPSLTIDGKYLPFNNINYISVVSKWIGPLENWGPFFEYVSSKGYNVIHFTPLQERGESDSPYSIFDQLSFDSTLFKDNKQATDLIHKVLKENNLLAVTDVVWNHTANNSEWIREHPDAGYNADTAPHLRAAIELEDALLEFSNNLENYNLPTEISSDADIKLIINGVQNHVINQINLWQYYVFDKNAAIKALEKAYNDKCISKPVEIPSGVDVNNIKELASLALKLANSNDGIILKDRFSNKLSTPKFLSLLYAVLGDNTNLEALKNRAERIIDEINVQPYRSYDEDVKSIKSQLEGRIRYLRLDGNGPKLGKITQEKPLIENYFTRFQDSNGKSWALANNGWIWGGNPLVDFASSQSKAYLRREVIVWSDCIKLRYGEKPEDSPYLWKRMIEYTELCAKTFSGFRIDNCHSTPLHVGEKLLDTARAVNPNLYVVAELFSGSSEMDKIFVERLGINTLIREAMQAWSVQELSTLVHKHGGKPIGSFDWFPLDEFSYPASKEPHHDIDSSSEVEITKILRAHAPHALFMDCSHDNETPAQKRTIEDTLPNAALVAFCSSGIGSVFGYDECYPELLNVVNEKRTYKYDGNGIGDIKKKLHAIRQSLSEESEDPSNDQEMYIHHDDQYITIQRYNSRTGKGWFLIARTKFSNDVGHQVLPPCVLGGAKVKAEFAYTLKKVGEYQYDDKFITGIPIKAEEIPSPAIEFDGKDSYIKVDDSFAPGSIAVFSTEIPNVNSSLDAFVKKGAIEASLGLDLYDLNAILYRCEPEERDMSGGAEGTYYIPNYGNLVYAGLEGWISVLKKVIWENDLAHPLSDHLRDGEWALDYVVNRLDKYSKNSKNLGKFQEWLRTRIDAIRIVPYYLRPHYFALVIGSAYEAARFRALRNMTPEIQTSTNFVQRLSLTSLQMLGYMNNTSLVSKEQVPSLAAGLPHFSNDYMRCWGRDVFISFRGMLLVPGRYEDAKNHILGFAQTLKHGMIPNLLDAGRNPRYNARDAAWFFLQAIQEYVEYAPDGAKILDEKVKRRFPLDDTYVPFEDERAYSYESSIREVIFEILQRHAKGIKYREANAGPNLDCQMKDEGFNVEVYIDWSTGLVHGGSQFNCGTWMDKMGESEKAGSKGVPGTPRDGAAVELQGLLKSALRFVNKLNSKGLFKYKEVKRADGTTISLKDWEKLVQDNFEKHFYVPENPEDDDKYVIDQSLVNRRGIYKDLYRTGKPYEDYQLRPNFPIAMVVAPELFSKKNALTALNMADNIIRGPVGMRTLDPSDWNYRPYYINSEDSDDFATSKGRNYHQGPEWVWCFGYFIRAFLYFNHVGESSSGTPSMKTLTAINERLQGHIKWIRESPWAGITELTNKDGELCHDSSPSQAWSTSCLLDLYFDLWNYKVYSE